MAKPRILISVPTKSHVEIATDEIAGLQDLGYDCLPFPYTAKKGFESKLGRLWVIIKNAFNLVKIARHFNPDIIYFNSRLEVVAGMRDFLTIMIFRCVYYKKVRFVIKSHGSDIEVLTTNQFLTGKIVLPYLKKHVAAWLFLSTQERDEVARQNYFYNDRIFVVKNIVRAAQFTIDVDFKRRRNISPDSKVLLFAGRVIEEKGIFEVIRAFAMIVVKHNAVLIINGDGAAFYEVKKLIDSLGLNSKVICTGFIPEQEVVQYYANSDILVFPTFFPEGFPMALFNAVAAGLSVVTTKTRAAIDFLSEPENCLWVEAKDANNVYTAVDTLLRSDTLMADMRRNNKAKAVLFSQTQVCIELAQIIETVFIRPV